MSLNQSEHSTLIQNGACTGLYMFVIGAGNQSTHKLVKKCKKQFKCNCNEILKKKGSSGLVFLGNGGRISNINHKFKIEVFTLSRIKV